MKKTKEKIQYDFISRRFNLEREVKINEGRKAFFTMGKKKSLWGVPLCIQKGAEPLVVGFSMLRCLNMQMYDKPAQAALRHEL